MTTTEPDAPQADPYVCEHCDSSVPHTHVDEKPLVEGYRTQLLRGRIGSAAVVVLGLIVLAVTARNSAFGLLLGILAWVVATGLGLAGWLLLRRSTGEKVAVLIGAMITAGAAPLLALAPTAWVDGPVWARALAAALGWLAVSVGTSGARASKLRSLLAEHSRDGEAARSAVVRTGGRPSPYVETAWLVATGALFGLYVAAAAVLPVLVVVLVPLNVALAVLSRRWQARAASQG